MARIFVSYKHGTRFDEPLMHRVVAALATEGMHSVFTDTTMLVGEDWVKRIQVEVEAADFLILLLSEDAIQSQMVVEEVRLAEAARLRKGRPRILPVRVAYEGALPYDLGVILNRLNYTLWRSAVDDVSLFAQLAAAINGGNLPNPELVGGQLPPDLVVSAANPLENLEAPEGTMSAQSSFYVTRSADDIVLDEERHAGYTLTILGPRQMGKSSLLGRVMSRALLTQRAVAFVDFQSFGQSILEDSEKLYYQFCFLIEDALGLESQLDEFWSVPISPPQKCRRFMERRILPACAPNGLLLALDEADALLDSSTRSDFFGMLRSWHNERAIKPAWRKLAIAMAISTEPSMLISNLSQSPFNVGTTVKLDDFGVREIEGMNEMHGRPLNARELEKLHQLLSGHPYLSRKAFYLLGRDRYSFAEIVSEANSEVGPFGDHLRALLARLQLRPEVASAFARALGGFRIGDDFRHRLIAGGLLTDKGGSVSARNRLYDMYFRRVLCE